jgi:hypothetical protein
MKIRPVRAELFHADGRTDRHDEAKSRISNFANRPKNEIKSETWVDMRLQF